MLEQIGQQLRTGAGDELHDTDAVADLTLEPKGFPNRIVRQVADDVLILNASQYRKVDAVKGIEGAGHHLLGTGASDDAAVKDQGDVFRIVVTGVVDAVPQVHLGIGAVGVDGHLGAGDDDGLSGILDHVTQGGRGVGHGIGAVGDDEAVVVVVVGLNGTDDLRPDLRRHIGGVDVAHLLHVNVAVALHSGHILQNLRRRQCRLQAVLGLLGGDGASRAQQQYLFHRFAPFPSCGIAAKEKPRGWGVCFSGVSIA